MPYGQFGHIDLGQQWFNNRLVAWQQQAITWTDYTSDLKFDSKHPGANELTELNSLAPEKFEWNFKHVIFKQILVIDGWGISCEITLQWMSLTGLHWWSVNIGSGNGLVPSGNKPLPEPVLTKISNAIWRH